MYKLKAPNDDVHLMNGAGFMVRQERYNAHLKVAKEIKEVNIYPVDVLKSFTDSCRNRHVMNIGRSTRQTFFGSTFSTEALGVLHALGMDVMFLIQ